MEIVVIFNFLTGVMSKLQRFLDFDRVFLDFLTDVCYNESIGAALSHLTGDSWF